MNNTFAKALEESDMREVKKAAEGMYQLFQALVKAGFEKQDALTILTTMMQNGKEQINDR